MKLVRVTETFNVNPKYIAGIGTTNPRKNCNILEIVFIDGETWTFPEENLLKPLSWWRTWISARWEDDRSR